MENKVTNVLVRHASHVIERNKRFGELSDRQNMLAAYALIAKIDGDEGIPEEAAEAAISATAFLVAIMASMPTASLSPIDVSVAAYDDLLALLGRYIGSDGFACDMAPYVAAHDVFQEIYAALDGYLN